MKMTGEIAKEVEKYIPLDKSWIIRMDVLDIINNYSDIKKTSNLGFLDAQKLKISDITKFLSEQKNLGDDLNALYNAAINWHTDKPIDVGESATLYRFLKFASWKYNLDKKFILRGTLKERKICNNQKIINWDLEKLLTLDNGTSQWASASVLMGNKEEIKNPPYKLKLSYEAVEHWNNQRNLGLCWLPRSDETILKQAIAYIEILKTGKTDFVPKHSEDYCFARVFDLITPEEAKQKWPSLEGHESNRIEYMEKYLSYFDKGIGNDSKDHRIIQAVAMLSKIRKKEIKFVHINSVNKSWPKFWDFLEYCEKLNF